MVVLGKNASLQEETGQRKVVNVTVMAILTAYTRSPCRLWTIWRDSTTTTAPSHAQQTWLLSLTAREVGIRLYVRFVLRSSSWLADWLFQVTTDKSSKRKPASASTHGSTSAAAPNVVFALTLEARYGYSILINILLTLFCLSELQLGPCLERNTIYLHWNCSYG